MGPCGLVGQLSEAGVVKETLCPTCAGIGEVWAPAGWGERLLPSGREILIPCRNCHGSGLMPPHPMRLNHDPVKALEAAVDAVESDG